MSKYEMIQSGVMLLSALLLVVGWMWNDYSTRRAAVAKERRRYRIEMLKSFFSLRLNILENKLTPTERDEEIKDVYLLVQLYGYSDELQMFRTFLDYMLDEKRVLKDREKILIELTYER